MRSLLIPLSSRAKSLAGWGLIVVLFCYLATVTLLLHKQFIPNYDLLLESQNARALLLNGQIPARGSVSGFLAFNPPGVSWALVPGVLLFPSEAALAERVPALLLLALTLVGLFLLVYRRFGVMPAVCACAVFALSSYGFAYADWRWNRAHPVFLIWFLYFIDDWAGRRRPQSLAWALVVWAASNYWMLEGVSAIVILPVVWLVFRPPILWRYVLLGACVGAMIWYPYLAFEMKRGFVDLRANVSRTNARTDPETDFRNALFDQRLKTTDGYRRHKIDGTPTFQWIYNQQDGWTYQASGDSVENGIRGKWAYIHDTGRWKFKAEEALPPPPGSTTPAFQWIYDPQDGWTYQSSKETVENGIRGKWTYINTAGRWTFKTGAAPKKVAAAPRLALASTAPAKFSKAGKIWKLIFVGMPDTRMRFGPALLVFLLVTSVAWGLGAPVGNLWRTSTKEHWRRPFALAVAAVILAGGMWTMHLGRQAFGLEPDEGLVFVVFWAFSLVVLPAWLPNVISGLAGRFFKKNPAMERNHPEAKGTLALVIATAAFIPWVMTILVMVNDDSLDPGRRFLWLWVAQGTVIVLFLCSGPWNRFLKTVSVALLILLVGLNDASIQKTLSWHWNGFHAAPANEFNNMVDFIGRRIKAEGRTSASVGYDIPFLKWLIDVRAVDGVSKVGGQYDLAIQTRYGITNLDSRAEGVSPDDEFRIVEYASDDSWRQTYFDLSEYPEMTPIYTSPCCAILKRPDPPGASK